MKYQIVRRAVPDAPPVGDTVLAQTAALLSAGQSMAVPTVITRPTIAPDSDPRPITKWASSGCYDHVNKRVLFNGKREAAVWPYWLFKYTESTNISSIHVPWSSATVSGHGYDHSAVNSLNGHYYHREYNDLVPHRLIGDTWDTLPNIGGAVSFASSLVFVPTIGAAGTLLTVDPVRMRALDLQSMTWSLFKTLGGVDQNHNIAEYNPISNILVFGSGNSSSNVFKMDCSGPPYTITAIATPPYNIGSSNTQGNFVANPNGPGFISHAKGTTSWHHWTPASDAWAALSVVSGSGESPANGMPNLVTGSSGADVGCATITVPVSSLGIFLTLEYLGTAGGRMWATKPAA